MDASAYSLISTGSSSSSSGGGGGSTSGDSGYLDHHTNQFDHHHLHHPHHHHSLSNLINDDEDLEHDYHLNSHTNQQHHHHHNHHLHHHHVSGHGHAHAHGHQLRHSSSPYGLDLLTSSDQSLMGVDSCELLGLGASDDDDDLQGTLTSFVCTDLGAESDTGYTSGVDGYFNHSSTSLIDHCASSDSQDAYCFRQFSLDSSLVSVGCTESSGVNDHGTSPLLMCQQNNNHNNLSNNLNSLSDFNHSSDNQSAITNFSGCSYLGSGGGGSGSSASSSICSASNYSDIINNSNDFYTGGIASYYGGDCTQPTSDMTCQQQHNSNPTMGPMQQNQGQTTKRSVLMNLLIDGSDIGAGYTSINSRALQSIN